VIVIFLPPKPWLRHIASIPPGPISPIIPARLNLNSPIGLPMSRRSFCENFSRPFGYDVVPDGEVRRLVPNAAEQATIDRMKTKRQDGAPLRAIGAVTGHGPKSVQRIRPSAPSHNWRASPEGLAAWCRRHERR
jgi:hypothetical protein